MAFVKMQAIRGASSLHGLPGASIWGRRGECGPAAFQEPASVNLDSALQPPGSSALLSSPVPPVGGLARWLRLRSSLAGRNATCPLWREAKRSSAHGMVEGLAAGLMDERSSNMGNAGGYSFEWSMETERAGSRPHLTPDRRGGLSMNRSRPTIPGVAAMLDSTARAFVQENGNRSSAATGPESRLHDPSP